MELEYEVKMIPINDQLDAALTDLRQQGWGPVTGFPPVAIYFIARPKNRPPQGLGGDISLRIDDSKVFIKRGNGQIE